MKFFTKLSWIPSLMVVAGLLAIASCGGDDEKPKAGIQFETTEIDVNESDGVIEITISIDRPLTSRVVLAYSLSGSAIEGDGSGENDDYEMNPPGGFISIDAGDTEAQIEIELFEDFDLEYEYDDVNDEISSTVETIMITLTEVVSGPAKLGEQTNFTVNVFEDDLLVFLTWEALDGNDVVVADMDIFVWFNDPEDDPDEGHYVVSSNAVGGGTSIDTESEQILLLGASPEAAYGLSFVYYEGSSDELEFTVTYVNFGGTINGGESSITQRTGIYTQANINRWTPEDFEVIKVQDFAKTGFNIVDLTEISIPVSSSRVGHISQKIDHSKFKREAVRNKGNHHHFLQ